MAQSALLGPAGLCVLVAASTAALAQTPPSAGSILRQQEQASPRRIDQLTGREPVPRPRAPLAEATGLRVTVKSVHFNGIAGIATEAELAPLVQDAIGKELAAAQLLQLADRVTEYLKAKGWFLARAYLPQQDITGGDLEIAILAGRLDGGLAGIAITGDAPRLSPRRIRATIAGALTQGGADGLHAAELERGLLLLGDLPGISARSVLERGTQHDSTRLNVEVTEGPLTAGSSAVADNYGSIYTGEYRATGQLRLNDPSGQGDAAGLGVVAAGGLTQISANYAIPLGYSGLSLAVNAGALRYRIGRELAALNLSGSALTAGTSLLYPFHLGAGSNLRGSLGYDFKALKDKSFDATVRDKRVTSVTAGFSGDMLDELGGGGASNFAVTAVSGNADLSRAAADLVSDQAGPRVNGRYSKWTYAVSRLQKVQAPVSLYASLNGQGAGNNLDSSEKFILGGPGGVRAYPGGEGSGDSGWVSTFELRYDQPETRVGSLQWLAFVDGGQVTLNNSAWGPGAVSTATGRNRYSLAGWGLGLNMGRSGAYSLRLAWARRFGDNPGRSVAGNDSDGRASRNRLMLQGTFFF